MNREAPAADLDEPALSIERLTAQPPDAEALERIGRESFPDRPFRVDEELARPWTRFWVARHSAAGHDDTEDTTGPGVGFVIAWHVADELHVLSIATAPAERGRGIATALMRVALGYASAERVRLVLLEVRPSNRAALRLYRRLGFSVMGVRPKYYVDNDEDALQMVLALDPATGRVVPGHDDVRIEL